MNVNPMVGRLAASVVLAMSVAACGGHGGGASRAAGSSPPKTGDPNASCAYEVVVEIALISEGDQGTVNLIEAIGRDSPQFQIALAATGNANLLIQQEGTSSALPSIASEAKSKCGAANNPLLTLGQVQSLRQIVPSDLAGELSQINEFGSAVAATTPTTPTSVNSPGTALLTLAQLGQIENDPWADAPAGTTPVPVLECPGYPSNNGSVSVDNEFSLSGLTPTTLAAFKVVFGGSDQATTYVDQIAKAVRSCGSIPGASAGPARVAPLSAPSISVLLPGASATSSPPSAAYALSHVSGEPFRQVAVTALDRYVFVVVLDQGKPAATTTASTVLQSIVYNVFPPD